MSRRSERKNSRADCGLQNSLSGASLDRDRSPICEKCAVPHQLWMSALPPHRSHRKRLFPPNLNSSEFAKMPELKLGCRDRAVVASRQPLL